MAGFSSVLPVALPYTLFGVAGNYHALRCFRGHITLDANHARLQRDSIILCTHGPTQLSSPPYSTKQEIAYCLGVMYDGQSLETLNISKLTLRSNPYRRLAALTHVNSRSAEAFPPRYCSVLRRDMIHVNLNLFVSGFACPCFLSATVDRDRSLIDVVAPPHLYAPPMFLSRSRLGQHRLLFHACRIPRTRRVV